MMLFGSALPEKSILIGTGIQLRARNVSSAMSAKRERFDYYLLINV
ncbi:MAG TPA: hypothetical protein VIW64_01205 [Pyrinomonadaceae bacterium]